MSTTATKSLVDLNKEIEAKQAEGEEIIQRAEEAGGYSPDQVEALKSIRDTIKGMVESRKSLQEQEALVSEFAARRDEFKTARMPVPFSGGAVTQETQTQHFNAGQQQASTKSVAEQLTEHETFQGWMKHIAPLGTVGEATPVKSPTFEFGSLLPAGSAPRGEVKALVTGLSATSAGALFNNFFIPLPDPAGTYQRPLSVLDLVTRIPVQGDTVEYPRIGTPTNAAAPVAEATSGADGAKPESAFPTSVVTDTIRNIAHWVPITRRALADAPQMRAILDQFLRYGLLEEVEDQVVTGSGAGQNFTGVRNVSGIQTQAFSTNILETTRKALTKAQVTGRVQPNGYVFHPNDWEEIDLLQDNEARYYMGGPRDVMTPRLWGVPVVLNEGMTADRAVLGDWRWAWLFDREQTAVYVTDSHSDWFVRNIVVILAELRAALGVPRPSAFVDITLA